MFALTLPILQISQACHEEMGEVVPEINALGFHYNDTIVKNGEPKAKC